MAMSKVATINVLMCGGRRTGKTAVMAALERNVLQVFSNGDVGIKMQNTQRLVKFREMQNDIINDYSSSIFKPEETEGSSEQQSFHGSISLMQRTANTDIDFTDIPGEWYIDPGKAQCVEELIRQSHILIMAIDTPHLIESDPSGTPMAYHQAFNRPEQITDHIIKAWSGEQNTPRMILFVPMKCEKYINENRMGDVLEAVKAGYQDLIRYVMTQKKEMCEMAVTPCVTMGGLEFLQFMPIDPDNPSLYFHNEEGQQLLNLMSTYVYLMDNDSNHFYKPQYCEQPLIYCLLFLVLICQMKNNSVFQRFVNLIKHGPNQQQVEQAHGSLLDKLLKGEQATKLGVSMLNDPWELRNR